MTRSTLHAVLLPLLLLGQDVTALPRVNLAELVARQGIGTTPPPSHLQKSYCPHITAADPVDGDKWQAGNSAPSDGALGYSTTYTEGSSFTIGADIGMSPSKVIGPAGDALGGSAGLSFSYTETVSKGVTIGNNLKCPVKNDKTLASYRCSQIVTPGFIRMRGNFVEIASNENCPMGIHGDDGGDWELWVPRVDKSENPFYSTDVCLCDGDGMDEENAPELKCMESCTGSK